MRVRKFGHACLLVEEGDTRVLIDPGTLADGWESLTGLTAVLVTHQHADHLDLDRLPNLVKANPDARLLLDAGSTGAASGNGWEIEVVTDGDHHDFGDLSVDVVGRDHAVIHPEIPVIPNVGYVVTGAGGRNLFHPGDALTIPSQDIETLAVPATAPWARVSEFVDYLRAINPRRAIPIHEAVFSMPQMAYGHLNNLKPATTEFTVIDDGEPITL